MTPPTGKALVIGASGFIGSHLTQQLVTAGRKVRILTRPSSNTQATDHLDIERCTGDVTQIDSLQQAMTGCSSVFYCVADTRTWLKDPLSLLAIHVDGLYNAMDAAIATGIERFIFTSSFITVGHTKNGPSNEDTAFNWWDSAPEYIRSLVTAEKRFLEYCIDHHLYGIACCMGNAYGSGDYAPTPQGKLILNVSQGKLPFYWSGGCPSVGIHDAAKALILAEQYGINGQRYVIAERWLGYKELFKLAASTGKVMKPNIGLPLWLMTPLTLLRNLVMRMRGKTSHLNTAFFQCIRKASDIDNSKTKQQLHWRPEPVERAIIEAVEFYQQEHQKHTAPD